MLIYNHTAVTYDHTHAQSSILCTVERTVKNMLTRFPLHNAPWCVWQVGGCDLWRWKCFNWWRCLGYERSLQVARNRGEEDGGTERQTRTLSCIQIVPLPSVLSDPVTLLISSPYQYTYRTTTELLHNTEQMPRTIPYNLSMCCWIHCTMKR